MAPEAESVTVRLNEAKRQFEPKQRDAFDWRSKSYFGFVYAGRRLVARGGSCADAFPAVDAQPVKS
jgi:hypothetical protein